MSTKWYALCGNEGDTVISTRIRLARNLSDYPFPVRLDAEGKKEVAEKIYKAAKESGDEQISSLMFMDMSTLTKEQAVSLAETHLISPEFASDTEGRYLLLSKDDCISIMINEEDHLRIQILKPGFCLKEAYEQADKIDTVLDKALKFAFSKKLGFLTQCPTNLGTGLRASVMLHLPALQSRHAMDRISVNLAKLGLVLRGTYGEGSAAKGALYQLSNQVTLGITEKTALENLQNITMQLVSQERESRRAMKENLELLDTIDRSLGLIKSARLLSGDECMKLLSNIRLGIALGEIKDISYDTINELMITLQPATLMVMAQKTLSPQERDVKRAEKIREKLS